MKKNLMLIVFFLLGVCTACTSAQTAAQHTVPPTTAASSTPTPTATITPTLTPTQTLTPTPFPTPQGELVANPMGDFSFLLPSGFELNTGIYRYLYSFASIFQGEDYWQKAIILIDMDISDQPALLLSVYLLLALENLDYFNAAAENIGEPFDLMINEYDAQAINFSGNTQGIPIQGQIIGYEISDDHLMVGVSWADVSVDPEAWNNEGVYLFGYVMESVVIGE
jgi:hypothetical protein